MSGPEANRLPWVRIVAEGAAIIVSILMAFAIDAWWDRRSDRVEEQQVLARLAGEFGSLRDELAFYVQFDKRALRNIQHVDSVFAAATVSGRSTVQVSDTALAFLLTQGTFAPILPTLDGLRTSGRMTIIRDLELLAALAAWPAALVDAVEHQVQSERFIMDHLYPALAKATPSLDGAADQILIRFGFPIAGTGTDPRTPVTVTPELAAAVDIREVLMSAAVLEFRDLEGHLEHIIGLLQK